jgi:hypothetical protein
MSFTWYGVPEEELSREDLIEMIKYLSAALERERYWVAKLLKINS